MADFREEIKRQVSLGLYIQQTIEGAGNNCLLLSNGDVVFVPKDEMLALVKDKKYLVNTEGIKKGVNLTRQFNFSLAILCLLGVGLSLYYQANIFLIITSILAIYPIILVIVLLRYNVGFRDYLEKENIISYTIKPKKNKYWIFFKYKNGNKIRNREFCVKKKDWDISQLKWTLREYKFISNTKLFFID